MKDEHKYKKLFVSAGFKRKEWFDETGWQYMMMSKKWAIRAFLFFVIMEIVVDLITYVIKRL